MADSSGIHLGISSSSSDEELVAAGSASSSTALLQTPPQTSRLASRRRWREYQQQVQLNNMLAEALGWRAVPYETYEKEVMRRVIKVGSMFFSLARTFANSTTRMMQAALSSNLNRSRAEQQPINVEQTSARQAITATDGLHGRRRQSFTTTTLTVGDQEIRTNNCFATTHGNEHVSQVGKYDVKKDRDVLALLTKITGYGFDSQTREGQAAIIANQARLMLLIQKHAQSREQISWEQLVAVNPKLEQYGINKRGKVSQKARTKMCGQVLSLCHLVGVIEHTRRPAYEASAGHLTRSDERTFLSREFCFCAHVMTTHLLREGRITLDQVFDRECPFSMVTGTRLRNKPDHYFRDRFFAIYNKFVAEFTDDEQRHMLESAGERFVLSSKSLKQLFDTVSGPGDTPGRISDYQTERTQRNKTRSMSTGVLPFSLSACSPSQLLPTRRSKRRKTAPLPTHSRAQGGATGAQAARVAPVDDDCTGLELEFADMQPITPRGDDARKPGRQGPKFF